MKLEVQNKNIFVMESSKLVKLNALHRLRAKIFVKYMPTIADFYRLFCKYLPNYLMAFGFDKFG
jgi:hypothetical protein